MDIDLDKNSLSPESYKRRGWWRSRLLWAVVIVAALAVGGLLASVAGESSRPQTEPVVEGPPPYVSASGPVVPEKRARLSFTTTGRIRRLAVQPGDYVKQGQLLAQLEPSTFQAGAVSPSGTASDLYIVAPFDGTIGLVPINEWETVVAGTPVVVLGDLTTLRVEIEDLSESDAGRLASGQSADITFEAFPDRKVPGRVARISPMNNAKGGGVNYDVVVEFVGRDLPPIRWGMTAHADIHIDAGR
jgi:multidrug efflux pump subunit AcrA (membrane-fusion protein)